jgi:hypothetical protein
MTGTPELATNPIMNDIHPFREYPFYAKITKEKRCAIYSPPVLKQDKVLNKKAEIREGRSG